MRASIILEASGPNGHKYRMEFTLGLGLAVGFLRYFGL
ncbi:hypothetical protein RAZWK3B_12534 [Roseobacter sp. AzwK-3b]|nr:hypothetical protein RAZWK3B_12534 [Roseobacter sp. AzwK-3b]